METQCRFQIPEEGTGAFSTENGELVWLIKVHVQLGRGSDFWELFELPVPAVRQPSAAPKLTPDSDYQVIVNVPVYGENYLKVMPAILGFLPHLDEEQAGEVLKHSPVTLLANVTQDEAEIARGTLQAAGARVLVRRGGQLVKGRKMSDLPLPHDGPGEVDRALPVPSSEPDKSN